MNRKLGLMIFGLIAVPLGSGCFLIPQDAVEVIKDELPQSKNTLQINAVADGSGKTHVIACVADPIVCRNADGPFAAMIDTGAAVDMPFVVDFSEPDGAKVGRFQGDVTGDAAESTLTVMRNGEAATKSTVSLPVPPAITAPMEGATLSLATDQIKLAWDKDGSDQMEWGASVECPTGISEIGATTIPDTGEVIIDPAKLNLKTGETCKVALHLTRLRDGTIEKAFEGNGLITVKQTRSVTINVAP